MRQVCVEQVIFTWSLLHLSSNIWLDGDTSPLSSDVWLDGEMSQLSSDIWLDGETTQLSSDILLDDEASHLSSDVWLDGKTFHQFRTSLKNTSLVFYHYWSSLGLDVLSDWLFGWRNDWLMKIMRKQWGNFCCWTKSSSLSLLYALVSTCLSSCCLFVSVCVVLMDDADWVALSINKVVWLWI